MKSLESEKNITDIDRIQIVNNCYKSKAELVLKVPALANLNEKSIKNIMDITLG